MTARLEVHEHCFVNGPKAHGPAYKFSHSHEGGDVPHQHPNIGPASYTIDKDEWFARTGLRGAGRKRFTARPNGEQLPRVDLEDWQKSFDIYVDEQPARAAGLPASFLTRWPDGPGIALPARLHLACGMTAKVHDLRAARRRP